MPVRPATSRHPRLAALLITAAASLGIAARLFIPSSGGQVFFVLTRVFMLALPLVWFIGVEGGKLNLSWPTTQQGKDGVILGAAMFGVILGAYWLVGQRWIDPAVVRSQAEQIGLTQPLVYLASAVYFTVINALVEEYIWRWFLCRQCEAVFRGASALYVAALCFTLHHIIALVAYTGSGPVVLLGSLGVFLAGAIWSWCYLKYRSLWVCYISHLLADLAIALVGWHLLFGPAI
ncbi:MAG: lysostaphin resistance A-like protein [Elainellaceae cyanobacterium]